MFADFTGKGPVGVTLAEELVFVEVDGGGGDDLVGDGEEAFVGGVGHQVKIDVAVKAHEDVGIAEAFLADPFGRVPRLPR